MQIIIKLMSMSPEGTVDILETYKYQPRYDVLTTCSSNSLEVVCLSVWFVLGVLRHDFAEGALGVRAQ